MILSYYTTYNNHHSDKPGVKTTKCKINNCSIITSICPKYYAQLSCAKNSSGEI